MSSTIDTSAAQFGNGDASAPAMVQEEELRGLPRDRVPEHGTGTKVGDAVEAKALACALRHVLQWQCTIAPSSCATS